MTLHTRSWIFLVGLFLGSLFLGSIAWSQSAQKMAPLWTYRSPLGVIDASPALADIDHDGNQELVLASTSGNVIVLNRQGQQVWMQGVQIPISTPPTVANLDESPELEVLVVNQSGNLICMSGRAGNTLWHYALPGPVEWGVSAIVVADLTGDGKLEVIVGDQGGHVVCLSSEGELLWQYDGPHGSTYCPAVGPLGEKGETHILISGSKIPLLCLDTKGKELWRVQEAGKGASPILTDIDGDGQNEIITALDNDVLAVSAAGKSLWTHPMKKEIDGSLCAADANEDGKLEIYAIDLSGRLDAIGPDGKTLWTASVHDRARRSPAIADIDGDGAVEIIVAGYSGELYLFTAQGELKETITMSSTTNASPLIADLDGNMLPTLIFSGGDGSVTAFRWPGAKPNAKTLWPEYRYSSARKGVEASQLRSPVRIGSIDFGQHYVGSNEIALTIENPEEKPLAITITIDTGHAKPRVHHFERSDKQPQVRASYSLTGAAPSSVKVSCTVVEGDQLVAQRHHTAYVIPFKKEMADLRDVLHSVTVMAKTLPEAYGILGQVAATSEKLPSYERQVAITGTLGDLTRLELRDALRKELKTFNRLAKLTTAAAKLHGEISWPLQLSEANPWAPYGGLEEVIEQRVKAPSLTVEAFSGETESAALNVFNFGTTVKTVRVEIDDFTLVAAKNHTPVDALDVVELHEVLEVPTQMIDLSADALPRLNQAQTITLPAWDGRQLWLNFDTTHLAPGTWTSQVRLRTLEVDSKEVVAPITLTVWKPALPEKQPLRHCNWGYVHGSRHKRYEDQSLQDRVAHGNNVFCSSFVPRVKVDEQGNFIGKIDYSKHDEFAEKYARHGIILFQMTGGITGPAGFHQSDGYRKAYLRWMREWVEHLQDMGISYDQYAMYPVDEPGLNEGLVERYLFYAKLTREADPQVQMYTDPVKRITKEELTEMLPYVDIWCPNRIGFLLDVGADKLAIMKSSNVQYWNYECEGNAKHQSPLGYYRGQSWLAWHHDLTGIGFWSYCTSRADPWFKPHDTQDYLMTYQGDGVVSSKRWEAVRDGIEDYSMLTVLRDVLKQAKAEGADQDLVDHAESLLESRASSIAGFCSMYETTPGKSGLPGARKQADAQWQAIQTLRREIAKVIDQLVSK